jgi:NTE family protein
MNSVTKENKLTALILPGAGARGRLQAGGLKAVAQSKTRIDMIFGASSGALNGSQFLQGDIDALVDLWMNIKNSDVYNARPWHLLGKDKYTFDTTPLKRLLEKLVRVTSNKTPFFVSATDAQTLRSQTFYYNNFDISKRREILRASAALPLLFPPVQLWEREFVDGGIGRNMPLTRAMMAGAKRVIVLQPAPPASAGKRDSLVEEFARIIGMFETGIASAEVEAIKDARRLDPEIELILVQPTNNPPNSLLEFGLPAPKAKAILDEGYGLAQDALKAAGLWTA